MPHSLLPSFQARKLECALNIQCLPLPLPLELPPPLLPPPRRLCHGLRFFLAWAATICDSSSSSSPSSSSMLGIVSRGEGVTLPSGRDEGVLSSCSPMSAALPVRIASAFTTASRPNSAADRNSSSAPQACFTSILSIALFKSPYERSSWCNASNRALSAFSSSASSDCSAMRSLSRLASRGAAVSFTIASYMRKSSFFVQCKLPGLARACPGSHSQPQKRHWPFFFMACVDR
mmetsp:Transcript_33761/g.67314  ORF Transcript_33761/g.67314 Transcript_33761/m.67314 type:complete len:233 (-) Transcript_33761:2512-3210(-)